MRNFETYYNRMGKNLSEKGDSIIEELLNNNYNTIVDIGCANGALIEYISSAHISLKDKKFICFDKKEIINEKYSKFSKDSILLEDELKDDEFSIRFDDGLKITFTAKLKIDYFIGNTLTIFSSVLHELKEYQIKPIMDYVMFSKTIAIRDMYFESLIPFSNKEIQKQIVNTLYKDHIIEEMEEDYSSINWEGLDKIFEQLGFKKRFEYTYFNKFLRDEVPMLKRLTETTHRKQIWKRSD